METNQPTTSTISTTAYAAPPGMFGTKVPTSVAFVLGILVFLLPFTEIRCGGTKLMQKSGIDFAMGNEWKTVAGALPGGDSGTNKAMNAGKEQKGNTQYFILAALGLAVVGLVLSLAGSKGALAGGILTAILAAAALIAFMLELKKNFQNSLQQQAVDKASQGADDMDLDKISNSMNDIKPTLAFTPWFYIAIIAFVAAAIFCYLRMRSYRTQP